jgi:glycosyltransferase involved in cell wall biosynthesis
MNEGAGAASGDVFLFLHADTRLPEGFVDRVKQSVLDGAVGGAFLFGADMDTTSMNLIENMAHFRTYRMGIVFGDQAIFATREAFYRAGTFPEQPLMEDYELWMKLKRVGRRSVIPLSVTTSARKWKRYGTWRITLYHQVIMWLYLLGVGPESLAKWYEKKLKGKRDKDRSRNSNSNGNSNSKGNSSRKIADC